MLASVGVAMVNSSINQDTQEDEKNFLGLLFRGQTNKDWYTALITEDVRFRKAICLSSGKEGDGPDYFERSNLAA